MTPRLWLRKDFVSVESKRRIILESLTLLAKASTINLAFQNKAQKVAREYQDIDSLYQDIEKKKGIGIHGGLNGHYLPGSEQK